MQFLTSQEIAANLMTAVAQLLIGEADRHDELSDSVAIMIGESAPNLPTLRHWGDWSRQCGRPIICFAFEGGESRVPKVSLICDTDGRTRIFENCRLWQRRDVEPALLIPDSFRWGAYGIDADLQLTHRARPPVISERAAHDGMRRVYRNLAKISWDRIETGTSLPMPTKLRRLAA